MTYPSSTRPDEWAQAFAVWLQQDETVFDQDAMEDWFEAAFRAAGQAPAAPAPAAAPATPAPSSDGVWVSYYVDRSAVVPFGDELTALRHAVNNSCDARFVPFGKEVLEP